jgi:hypothetical protein
MVRFSSRQLQLKSPGSTLILEKSSQPQISNVGPLALHVIQIVNAGAAAATKYVSIQATRIEAIV